MLRPLTQFAVAATLLASSSLAFAGGKLEDCTTDDYGRENIEEARANQTPDDLELTLTTADGKWVGSLFASNQKSGEKTKLVGQSLYFCGGIDNYYYVNADDIRAWISKDIGDWKTVSKIETWGKQDEDSIVHDEAMMSASVETVDKTDTEAELRFLFQAWNFADQMSSSGEVFLKVPLK